MNDVARLQADDEQLRFLRARQQAYLHARVFSTVQAVVALALPIAGAIATALAPDWKPYIAAAALLAVALDTAVLDRAFRTYIKTAAKLSEEFDCRVLQLPWDEFNVSERVESEDLHALSKSYSRQRGDENIVPWYPIAAGLLPIHLGRIICQRSNISYDSALRRSYATILLAVASIVLVGLLALGLARNASMTQWVLTMAPATPFLAWSAKEYYRQVDAADVLESLRKKVRHLWNDALSGKSSPSICLIGSRELQTALYKYRSASPLVMPFLYRLKRLNLEGQMNAAADDFLAEYEKSRRS